MSVAQLDKALLELLDLVGREALQTLLFDPVEPEELDWHLACLSHRVAPVYLPLAADDSGILALHLWPGRDVADSPCVYVGEDQLELHYLCDGLHNLPVALWLWMGRYFKKGKMPALRQAVAAMAACIPGGRPVPDALWPLLESAPDYEPTWWHADATETTTRAWQLAEVGHPFVGVPQPDYHAKPEEALALLAPFVQAHREPELVGLLLGAQIEAGREIDRADVLFVLGAEAWRQSDCLMKGWWLPKARGLSTWDLVLRNLPDRGMLAGTPFAVLTDHPLAYSGKDREGPLSLGRVALAFREGGDPAAALRQFRNAQSVAILALGGYPTELVLASTAICNALAPNSLAAAIARRSIEIDREDL